MGSIIAFCLGCLVFAAELPNSAVRPWKLSANGRVEPVGVAPENLRLGWKLPTGLTRQGAYEIEADGVACGRIASDDNVAAAWPGSALGSGERHAWRVRVWDGDGAVTPWSAPATFTTARRADEPWTAKWIGPAARTRPDEDFGDAQWITAPVGTNGLTTLECAFDFDGSRGAVDFAFVSVASHSITVNGRRFVRWEGFANDWRYARFLDLAPMLEKGRNIVRVEVGADDGDAPGEPLPHIRHHGCARDVRAFIAKILLPDGRRLATDAVTWTSPDGRVAALGRLRGTDFGREAIVRQETASPAFEKTFAVTKPVKSAVLHVTGVGFYEAYLNGKKVGAKVLDPSPTAYDKRVLYSTYRLDGDVRAGTNALKLIVGHGWYDVRAIAVWNWDTAPWRDFPRTIAELRIDYVDGSHETVVTDGSWRQIASPVGYDDIREGEVVGCAGGAAPDFESETILAEEVPAPKGRLVPEEMPGAEVMKRLPAAVRPMGDGSCRFEFPQDVSGWIRLKMRGQQKGDVVVIRYDERDLTATGGARRIDMHFRRTASHRVVAEGAAFQTDRYVASGAAEETYEPRFTYNGFRFVTVKGLRRMPRLEDAEACFVHTAFETVGDFRCSDATFSKLMEMADCSYRCNYADGYPTDCPHREKNGWTGDANVASELAQYVYENTAGYEKWIGDLLDAQLPDGNLPGIVPTSGWGYHWGNGPYWDAALTVVPWNLWLYRGDRRALEMAYPGMRKYLAYTSGRRNAHGLVEHGLGDWIATVPEHMPSVELTSSCSYLQALRIAADTATALGRADEARAYGEEAARLRSAIRARFARADGVYENGGQTAQAVALAYGLVDPSEVQAARRRLVEAVERADVRLDCGLIGMKHLFRQLSEAGRTDLAFRLLTRDGHPSPVEWMRFGGSALWEDWRDGDSRNHIMFGDFVAWAYQYLAGIRLLPQDGHCAAMPRSAPAFREILLAPQPIAALDWVEARTETPQGRVASNWRRTADGLVFSFEIPGGTYAEVRLPDGTVRRVGPGVHRFPDCVGK